MVAAILLILSDNEGQMSTVTRVIMFIFGVCSIKLEWCVDSTFVVASAERWSCYCLSYRRRAGKVRMCIQAAADVPCMRAHHRQILVSSHELTIKPFLLEILVVRSLQLF